LPRKVLVDEHADVLQESVRWLVQQLMEVEVSELIGAEHDERRPEDRVTHRNGHVYLSLDTKVEKVRDGAVWSASAWLSPTASTRRADQAKAAGPPPRADRLPHAPRSGPVRDPLLQGTGERDLA
jgi:hypothetical protein